MAITLLSLVLPKVNQKFVRYLTAHGANWVWDLFHRSLVSYFLKLSAFGLTQFVPEGSRLAWARCFPGLQLHQEVQGTALAHSKAGKEGKDWNNHPVVSSFYKKFNNLAREVQTREADSAHSLRVMRFDIFFSRITGYRLPYSPSKMLSGWVSIFPRKYEQFQHVRACWSHHKVTVICVPARMSTANANQPGLRTPTSMMQP